MEEFNWLIWGACFLTGTLFVYGILRYTGSRRMVRDRFRKTPAAQPMSLLQGGGGSRRNVSWIGSPPSASMPWLARRIPLNCGSP